MCEVLRVVALLCFASFAAQLNQDCTELANRYALLYEIAVNEGSFRAVAKEGRPTQLVVWGGESGSPASAAAALLFVALRYGLGYDAVFQPQPLDVCTANATQLSVAPAVRVNLCDNGRYGHLFNMSGGTALVPLREPLLARASRGCTPPNHGAVSVYDEPMRHSCTLSLTLRDFKHRESELPSCNYNVRSCTTNEDLSSRVVLTAAGASSYEIDKVHRYICNNNVPLTLLRYDNVSCYRRTLQHLDGANLPFLFLDRDLWMYRPELLSVLIKLDETDQCPARDLNKVTDLVHRVGDGYDMHKYAPQVAHVVERFCPPLKCLKNILYGEMGDAISIEGAACKWALQNSDTFESWIKPVKREYGLYFYLCADDRLNEEYNKTIHEVHTSLVTTTHDHFRIRVHVKQLDCHDGRTMTDNYLHMRKHKLKYVMGLVAWSSSEGIHNIARYANSDQVPLVLVGPITPDTPTGPAVNAINGRLDHLAHFYRHLLSNCGWTRFAIISDVSTYAKAFTKCLLQGENFSHIERTVTSETVMDILRSLRAEEARVFIVNTNSPMAAEILRTAVTLGMTPPLCAWVVREWSPIEELVSTDGREMSHLSLGTAWRGADGRVVGGDANLRERLQALWPDGAWPALAAPLADAVLLLEHSFTIYQRLYSASPHTMLAGGYAMSFSDIYDRIRLSGVERELSFANGTVETVIVYLEQWRGSTRTVLASWDLREDRHRGIRNDTVCGARTLDRPPCSFPAGGRAFVQRCYDVPLISLFVVLALLPVVFVVARHARLKRLAVRDLNLLAHILESKQLSPVVHGDSLCMHRQIGTGNFGSVYLATLRQSKEKAILVAAKELRDESDKEEYLQEAGTLQQLDHDNVVKFVGICVFKGSLLILMEYAFYGDLLQYLEARRHLVVGSHAGPADEREAAHVAAPALTRLAREAAAALEYLARYGLVHRDVRAANCLIDKCRTLKLADFGLARKLCDNLEYTSIKRAMFPVLWMAPESLRSGTFSTASDVWALGVLCLELITLGGRPYGARLPQQVLAYVRLGGHPPLPPDASSQTVSLVTACWQHKAAERATASDVARYLDREPSALRPALLPAPDFAPA